MDHSRKTSGEAGCQIQAADRLRTHCGMEFRQVMKQTIADSKHTRLISFVCSLAVETLL